LTRIGLITVTHDPKGANLYLIEAFHQKLAEVYTELFITISNETSLEVVEVLENSKFNTKIIPKNGAADARRSAVEFGLQGTSSFYHYCDFDRLLTWCKNHFGELEKLIKEIPNFNYLIIGRSERAFSTHPTAWIETEKITNLICTMELGKEVDITAGSCSFSRVCAEFIHKYSNAKMTDAEWPMIIKRICKQEVGYLNVEGLEYIEDINGTNNETINAQVWLDRLRLSYIISETAINTGK